MTVGKISITKAATNEPLTSAITYSFNGKTLKINLCDGQCLFKEANVGESYELKYNEHTKAHSLFLI